jgi:hypothetical protein
VLTDGILVRKGFFRHFFVSPSDPLALDTGRLTLNSSLYSIRNAVIGFTRVARLAGKKQQEFDFSLIKKTRHQNVRWHDDMNCGDIFM